MFCTATWTRLAFVRVGLFLACLCAIASPVHAGLNGPETKLDTRIKLYLQQADKRWKVLAENPAYPKPNNALKAFGETEYYQKALAVFGLIDMGAAAKSRIPEINRLLRYAVRGAWPATTPTSVIGQYAKVWNHRDRSLAMRLYMLYSNWLEPDVKAEWEKRLGWLTTKPYTSSSENIRWSNNSAYFLAYEVLKRTHTQGFRDVKSWVVQQLKVQGNQGPSEWGSFYNAWTYSAILNLVDFAKDAQVKKLAQMAFDLWLARNAGASLGGRLATGGIRCYPWWIHGTLRGQTTCAQLMVMGSPEARPGDWLEFAITNYRAPTAVESMYKNAATGEAWVKSGPTVDMRYYHYKGDKFMLGVTMSPELPDIFRSFRGGTHDIAGVYVQSAARKPGSTPGQSSVMLLGYQPEKPPAKRINLVERYFGYKHVAFAQHGGTTKAVYAGGIFRKIAIRLFATHDFSREFDSGWAFLTNGTTYVAWAPTRGDPQNDPKSSGWYNPSKLGYVLRSSYEGDDKGEASVLDIGDAATYGSYSNFKAKIKSRNPRPRWVNDKVTYKALDGAVLEWSSKGAKVNGVAWSRSKAPTTQMPGLKGLKLTAGGANISFDFNQGKTTGAIGRIASNMVFGVAGNPVPGPLAIQTPAALPSGAPGKAYGPVTLVATGGTQPYVSWTVIGGTSLPPGITLDGKKGVLAGTPTQAGTFQTRIRVTDSAQKVQSRVFTFSFTATGQNAKPKAPTKMHVHSTNAQAGSVGNPVPNIDLSPVFSAVYTDPDKGDKADRVYIQVSTDDSFETIDAWNSGVIPLARPVANGARCVDIPYAGQALNPGTLYYWRMIFIDVAGQWGEVHTETLSFRTAAAKNNAPLAPSALFVGSTSAQTGQPSSSNAPATGIDLDPVFSAVFEDPDANDTTTTLWVQVATDPSFKAESLLWNAIPLDGGSGALTIASCKAKSRCADFPYGGKALQENTQYYWRMLFVDAAGQPGQASEIASFVTAVTSGPKPLTITTKELADATEGQGYSAPLAVTGGSLPYTWSTTSALPPGLALDFQGGLFGTPKAQSAGDYSLELKVTDGKGATSSATLSLRVLAASQVPGEERSVPTDGGSSTERGSPSTDGPGLPGPDGATQPPGPKRPTKGGCVCSSSGGSLPVALCALLFLCGLRRRPRPQSS